MRRGRHLAPCACGEPLYDVQALCGVIPVDCRKPCDRREAIACLVDASVVCGFKREYDAHTLCGQARIHGVAVGLLCNNGPSAARGAAKAGQFPQLCDQAGLPPVFLMNTTGCIVGSESEQGGIVRHGSKMIPAVTNVRVPRITRVTGGSFGAGNCGMSGRGSRSGSPPHASPLQPATAACSRPGMAVPLRWRRRLGRLSGAANCSSR